MLFTCLEFLIFFKRISESLYTSTFVDLYDACCSIFNEPARFQARRFRPALRDSLYIISPSPLFVNTFCKLFLSFLRFSCFVNPNKECRLRLCVLHYKTASFRPSEASNRCSMFHLTFTSRVLCENYFFKFFKFFLDFYLQPPRKNGANFIIRPTFFVYAVLYLSLTHFSSSSDSFLLISSKYFFSILSAT